VRRPARVSNTRVDESEGEGEGEGRGKRASQR